MRKRLFSPKGLAISAAIAAIYVVLTMAATFYFGPSREIQLRVSEALTLLPVILPEAVPGLFIGCLLANLLMGAVPLDILFGSLASLIAAVLTYRLRKNRYLAALPPVLVNAVFIGLMLHLVYGAPLIASMLYVAAGQAASCYLLGLPLLAALEKTGIGKGK